MRLQQQATTMITIAIDLLSTINRSEHSSNETKTHYSECHGVPSCRNVQRLVPGNPFGGWLRTPIMRHIAYCSYVPTTISKLRNERSPIVPQAILVGDQHASLPSWFVFFLPDSSTSSPFFFLFRRAEPPRGLHYNGDGKRELSFFFSGGSGERVILDVAYHSTKPFECLTLSS